MGGHYSAQTVTHPSLIVHYATRRSSACTLLCRTWRDATVAGVGGGMVYPGGVGRAYIPGVYTHHGTLADIPTMVP